MADLITVQELMDLATTPAALTPVPLDVLGKAITAASELALASLGNRYDMPIVSIDTGTKFQVARIATYIALVKRGRNPDMTSDDVKDGYKDAITWFKEVGDGRHTPGIVDSIPLVENDDAIAIVLPRGRNAWK